MTNKHAISQKRKTDNMSKASLCSARETSFLDDVFGAFPAVAELPLDKQEPKPVVVKVLPPLKTEANSPKNQSN